MANSDRKERIEDWKKAIATMVAIHQHLWDLDDRKLWPRHLPSIAASDESIRLVEQSLGALDPEHRDFMKHADGWRGFYQWVDLFGTKELLGADCRQARKAVELLARGPTLVTLGAEAADLLPIAASTKDIDLFVIVKPGRALAGNVIWLADHVVDRFASFSEFFRAMMDYNREEARDLLKERKARGLT